MYCFVTALIGTFFKVISYAVIVAEDDTKNSSGLEMPSWRDVQAYSVWPPFQVIEPYYPFQNSTVEDFIVGTESCDVRHIGYCNGPLKSGSTYRVKIRAFTAPDKFTDTSYSFPMQTGKSNPSLNYIELTKRFLIFLYYFYYLAFCYLIFYKALSL